ncbi:RHS repeat domain-containing protein, partial [Pseudomarimonas arenosa]|uniref:RHS repeat domain-containing protein n=1 Tax=Pseudomarimonas arenosa TaxID=2774145 RepID=UPI0022B70EF3
AALAKSRRYKGKRRRRWNCASRLRFPGQYYDSESGLHYNYFRDYDPSTGRYIESDPIGLDGGPNTYAYVEGRPLITFDDKGLNASGVSGPEISNCFSKHGWVACNQVKACKSEAEAFSEDRRPNDSGVGDRKDALRHCYLACCLASRIGEERAMTVLADHEYFSPPPPGRNCELVQDFYNNAVGVNVARAREPGSDCSKCGNAETLDVCPGLPECLR